MSTERGFTSHPLTSQFPIFEGEAAALLEVFEYYCRAKNLSIYTLRSYRQSLIILGKYAKLINKQFVDLTKDDIQQLLTAKLNNGWRGATANHRLRDWRVFYNFLIKEELIAKNPVATIAKCREEKRVKSAVPPVDIQRVLKTFDKSTFLGYRDYVMFLLMFDCMLRVNETVNIKLDDLKFTPFRQLRIFGKGAKERMLSFGFPVARKLKIYLTMFRRGVPGELLFPTRNGRRILTGNVNRTIKRASHRCGLHITPHLIRHAGATEMWRQTGDNHLVKMILGHSSVRTTQLYIHGDFQDIERQYEKFSPASSLHI